MQHTSDGTLPYYYLRQLRSTFESRLQIRRAAMLKSLGAKTRPGDAVGQLQKIAVTKRSSNWCL